MRSQQQLLNQVNTDSHCDLLKLIFISQKPSPQYIPILYIYLKLVNEETGKKVPTSYGTQTKTVAAEMEFLKNFMSLNEQERLLIGHHGFDSFIKGCTFRGADCLKEK